MCPGTCAKEAKLSAQEVSASHGPRPHEPSSAHARIRLLAPALWSQQRLVMQSS